MTSTAARKMARTRWADRRYFPISCVVCGRTAQAIFRRRRYCSNACRQRAKRQRQIAREKE